MTLAVLDKMLNQLDSSVWLQLKSESNVRLASLALSANTDSLERLAIYEWVLSQLNVHGPDVKFHLTVTDGGTRTETITSGRIGPIREDQGIPFTAEEATSWLLGSDVLSDV